MKSSDKVLPNGPLKVVLFPSHGNTSSSTSLLPYDSLERNHESKSFSQISTMALGSHRIIGPGSSASQDVADCYRIIYTKKASRAWEFTIIPCELDSRWLDMLDNQIENDLLTTPNMDMAAGLHERFTIIRQRLAFNKTEWAQIFGVSRVTIYSWIKGNREPLKENAERINALFHIVTESASLNHGDFISRNYLIQPFDLIETSLFELLKGPVKQLQTKDGVPELLRTLSKKSKKQADRIGQRTDSSEYRDWNLDYNLRRFKK